VYTMGSKEVGRWHGEKIALAKGTLHYTQVVDEKPPFDLLPNTRGILTAGTTRGRPTTLHNRQEQPLLA